MKFLALLTLITTAKAFDYGLVDGSGSVSLTDAATSISGVKTIFTNEELLVEVSDLAWEKIEGTEGSADTIFFETSVNGKLQSTGNASLVEVERELPTSIEAGSIMIPKGGRYSVEVKITLDDSEMTLESSYEAYGSGVAIIPLIVVLVLAMSTHMVEFSMFCGIFVGACIIAGNINGGFKDALETYILKAIADSGHAYVYLFTFFLSGIVAMMEKSGGMFGFTTDISRYATTPRLGQLACFSVGVFIFFDDYANCLLAGKTLRPLLDTLFVSREKLAFIVDATAAPIASISPVSSWVGFEIGLIQDEIDRIIDIEGTEDIGIKTSGFAVFLQSIRYRYYPIFMLIFMLGSILLQRDAGTMLIAERQTHVYKRTDGGNNASEVKELEGEGCNRPRESTPKKSWNLIIPVFLLVFFIFFLLVKSGEDGSDQSIMDKIESSDSYPALLFGTFAAAAITLIFYWVQFVRDGNLIVPDGQALKDIFMPAEGSTGDEEGATRNLMSLRESVNSFLVGLARVFPALIVLTLAWATAEIMKSVGADRLFSGWIVNGIDAASLPTLSFVISLFMAMAIGTSWGTMSILMPLILLPTYRVSGGDETIFYAVVAGVLSGSVAGDHVSPISDTTVLSALACDCNLLAHVATQVPYVVFVSIVSVLFGTLPIGYDAWPNIVGILLGIGVCIAFIFFYMVPIVSPTGKYDLLTELYMKVRGDEDLLRLQMDTQKAHNGENIVDTEEKKKLSEENVSLEEVSKPVEADTGNDVVEEIDA